MKPSGNSKSSASLRLWNYEAFDELEPSRSLQPYASIKLRLASNAPSDILFSVHYIDCYLSPRRPPPRSPRRPPPRSPRRLPSVRGLLDGFPCSRPPRWLPQLRRVDCCFPGSPSTAFPIASTACDTGTKAMCGTRVFARRPCARGEYCTRAMCCTRYIGETRDTD